MNCALAWGDYATTPCVTVQVDKVYQYYCYYLRNRSEEKDALILSFVSLNRCTGQKDTSLRRWMFQAHRCIRWPPKISNIDLWQRTGQFAPVAEIQQRKLGWISHTQLNITLKLYDGIDLGRESGVGQETHGDALGRRRQSKLAWADILWGEERGTEKTGKSLSEWDEQEKK